VISFVMQAQRLGFMEAVTALASEAGLEVPQPTPQAAEAERRRLDISAILQTAAEVYQRQLRAPDGRAALAYLRHRGLTDASIERFGLGWSGPRGALIAALRQQGATPGQLREAGLLRESEEEAPRELFFNRVMFPIRDRRGRVISFGGRMMGDGQPKYINGPETPVFSKRRTLFGLDRAREAARDGKDLLVVEGYLDVISMHQAGYTEAVAPLGTALTIEHLQEIWRISPTPRLCFDGDGAGDRAAAKTVELALPALTSERTLKIIQLPPGEDPDTLLRKPGGKAALDRLLASPISLVDQIYRQYSADIGQEPEQQARLLTLLDAKASTIADKILAKEYQGALRGRFCAARRERYERARALRDGLRPRRDGWDVKRQAGPPPNFVREPLAQIDPYPQILHTVEHAYADLTLPEEHNQLRTALLEAADLQPRLDSDALMDHLAKAGLKELAIQVLSNLPCPLPECAQAGAMPAKAVEGWWHFFDLLNPGGIAADIAEAQRDMQDRWDLASQRRLLALKAAQARLVSEPGDAEMN
jgi:DNA primase